MPERAWSDVIEDLFTGRAQPPRQSGLTMIIDKGWGLTLTHDLIEGCGASVRRICHRYRSGRSYDSGNRP
jgi:phosphosulfolactate synthase (CoM biosynthesis protein A)